MTENRGQWRGGWKTEGVDDPPLTIAASPRVLLVLVVGVVAVGIGLWAAVSLAQGDDDPPVVSLACADVVHRPLIDEPAQVSLRLGFAVDDAVGRHRLEVVTSAGSASVTGEPGIRFEVQLPVSAATVDIDSVTLTPAGSDADPGADAHDGTETALAEAGPSLVLPATTGPVAGGLQSCAAPSPAQRHPGYPFAAPVPAFGSGTPAAPETAARIADFVGGLVDASDRSASDELFDSMHPVAVEGYGEEICRAQVSAVAGAVPPMRVDAVSVVPDYVFDRPGGSVPVAGVHLVEVTATVDGDDVGWRFNVAVTDEGVRWLGACGN